MNISLDEHDQFEIRFLDRRQQDLLACGKKVSLAYVAYIVSDNSGLWREL